MSLRPAHCPTCGQPSPQDAPNKTRQLVLYWLPRVGFWVIVVATMVCAMLIVASAR